MITTLFFFGLPTYFLAFGLERVCQSHSRDVLETQFNELDSILFGIGKHSDALEYFSNLLSSLGKAAGSSNERKEFLEKEIQSINKRFPGTFAFVCVDSNGDLLSDISEKGISKVLGRKLYFSLLDSANETPGVKNKEVKKNWGLYLNYVGAEANPDRLEIPMKLPIETNIGEKKHWFFAFVDSRGGIFSHINKTPDMERSALVDQIRSSSGDIPQGAEMGIYDIQKDDGTTDGAVLGAMGEFQRTTRRHFQIGGNIYGILPFSPTLRIWIRVSNYNLARIGALKNCFLLIILIFFAYLSHFLLKKMVLDDPIYFSIKVRLPVLFFFAGGFPAFVLLFCGWDYILQKRQERVHALHEETEGVLRSV